MQFLNTLSLCCAAFASLGASYGIPPKEAITARSLYSRQSTNASTLVLPTLPPPRDPPSYTHLYTANAIVLNSIFAGTTPVGTRVALPCVGGNFSGPYFTGKAKPKTKPQARDPLTFHAGQILDSGADYGIYDSWTGQFTADTRYNLLTDDGKTIMVSTHGSQVGGTFGEVHVHVTLETGDKDLYWINHADIVGTVDLFNVTQYGFSLRLTTWFVSLLWEPHSFLVLGGTS
jgi:hypothetical protein